MYNGALTVYINKNTFKKHAKSQQNKNFEQDMIEQYLPEL